MIYDYNAYEEKAMSFLIYSSYVWTQIPEEVKKYKKIETASEILKIGKEIDKTIPNTYYYLSYIVES